jgi:hypothetical protein
MKNYKVEAIMKFTDKEENVRRDMGDVFDCSKERYEYLKAKNAVKLLEITEEKKEEIVEPEKKENIKETIEENFENKPKKKKHNKK